jgi:alpha-tubulin suppressor-like RCC1 family protein/plastocyanin
MSQTKAQLIQPIGIVTAGGVVVTGVVTASSFDGEVVGTATSIISGGNLNLGDVNATTFSGDFTGNATGINTGADIKVGQFTASSFTGDFTGTATSMMRGTGFKAGAVNATGFNVSGTSAGTIAGNVTGNVTGDVTGVSTGNVTGNVTGNITGYAKSVTSGNNIHVGVMTATSYHGDGSALTGIAATNFNTQTVPGSTYSINVTNDGSGAYTLSGTDRNGSVSGNNAGVSVEVGDTLNFVVDASGHPFYIRVSDGGANVSTPAATNQGTQSGTVSWTPNTAGTYYYQCGNHAGMIGTITVTATSTMDLSAGNCITFNQSADTTISFASTDTAMDVTIIRAGGSSGTITWPTSIKWNGAEAPTLVSSNIRETEVQQFQFLTRDSGVTWYGWENMKNTGGSDVELYGWGDNGYYGHLGLNSTVDYSSPTQLPGTWGRPTTGGGNPIAGGEDQNLALKTDGTLYTWGRPNQGQLGRPPYGETANRSAPAGQVPGTTWNGVFCGQEHSAATKSDGTLWAWGNNTYGQMGDNSRTQRSSPIQVPGTWDPLKTVGGRNMMMMTKNTTQLYIWGQNEYGTLGLNKAGNHNSRSSPTQLPGAWKSDGLYSGYEHIGGIKSNDTLFMWGRNEGGNLGQNNTTNRSSPIQVPGTWSMVTGGNTYTVATKPDGTLWAWGSNGPGCLGQNNRTQYSSPTQIPGTTWDKVYTGNSSGVHAFKTDGTLWSWGSNYEGMLGHNKNPSSQGNYSSPTQIPGLWDSSQGMGGGFFWTFGFKAV